MFFSPLCKSLKMEQTTRNIKESSVLILVKLRSYKSVKNTCPGQRSSAEGNGNASQTCCQSTIPNNIINVKDWKDKVKDCKENVTRCCSVYVVSLRNVFVTIQVVFSPSMLLVARPIPNPDSALFGFWTTTSLRIDFTHTYHKRNGVPFLFKRRQNVIIS